MERYELAKERIAQIPDEKMAEEPYCDFFTKEAVADSISHIQLESKTAVESKKELYDFFQVLYETEPKLIGSKMPDANFIWNNQ